MKICNIVFCVTRHTAEISWTSPADGESISVPITNGLNTKCGQNLYDSYSPRNPGTKMRKVTWRQYFKQLAYGSEKQGTWNMKQCNVCIHTDMHTRPHAVGPNKSKHCSYDEMSIYNVHRLASTTELHCRNSDKVVRPGVPTAVLLRTLKSPGMQNSVKMKKTLSFKTSEQPAYRHSIRTPMTWILSNVANQTTNLAAF